MKNTEKYARRTQFEEEANSQDVYTISYTILDPKRGNPARSIDVRATPSDISHLIEHGYIVLPNFISSTIVEELRNAVDAVCHSEVTHKTKVLEPCAGSYYLRHLIEKHPTFRQLFHLQRPLSIARAVLGPQVQFDEITARVTDMQKQNAAIAWHIHHPVVLDPPPPFYAYPHAINALLYLDDVDNASGPLSVLPGSHAAPPKKILYGDCSDKSGEVVLPVTAGTCILIHANLWHRALPSEPKRGWRRLLILGYLPSWLRTEEAAHYTPPQNVTKSLRSSSDPQIRELAGDFRWG